MSNQKRRLASPDSDPYSSSPPSVEGTSVWSGKKGRVPRQTPRGKDLEMQMEEQQIKMKELESQMEEMKKLRKGVKELKRKNKEQENEIKELRNREEEREKEMKKLKKWVKEIRNKPDSNCLSSGNPTVQEGNTKRLKLHIEMKVPKRAYTGGKLAGDPGNSIPIKLIDVENGLTITSGTESSVTVHVVALKGNFNKEEHDYWSAAYFNSFIVEGRQQKGQPLVGTLKVTLKEGVGFINNLKFMDNSSWSEEKKFRIGVHVDSGYKGTRILEAFTEPIIVLEQRGSGNKKHDTPESSDEVWRLEGIGKGGPFHNRLKGAGIYNVEEFLQTFNRDSEKLKSILGRTMTDPKWFPLINHAQKCPPNEKWLVYYSSDGSNNAALFDNFARSTGFICNGVPRLIHSLSDREKEAADCLVELAYRNWKEVTKYEGIIPRREAVAVPLGIDDMILISPSTAQNHPTQTSLQGRSSIPDETTNSSVAAKEATVSQQPFQGETSTDALPAVFTSPQGSHGIFDGLSLDEFLIDWTHLEKP